MDSAAIAKMVSIFITSILLPKLGFIMAQAARFNLIQTIVSVGGAGIFGSFLFTYLFDKAIPFFERKLDLWIPSRTKKKKRVFTWKSRFIIKAKRNFGVIGIAAISPLFISIPLGAFLALRFFGSRKVVFLWLCAFCILWSVIMHYALSPLQTLFHDK